METREAQIREVDILVEGKGAIQLAADVATVMKLHPPVVFERFGTAHLDFDHRALEFVSSRVESYYPSSRKPQVSPGTLKDDVMRRDFTVNTLLMEWDGSVLDLTGRGLADLESRRIVTPLEPESTFDEDPLRMLRAIRFAATLDFTLDASVEAAIRNQSGRLQPPTVSMERIRDEVLQGCSSRDQVGADSSCWTPPGCFAHPAAARGRQGDAAGRLAQPRCLRPWTAGGDACTAGRSHATGCATARCRKPAVHELATAKPTFIGHQDVGAVMAVDALKRLRYPGEVIDSVGRLIRLHMRPIQYDPNGWEDKAVRRLVRDAGQLDRLLTLARADMRASHYPDVTKIDHLEARIRRLDAGAINAIRSPLSGDDLMARTGRPAGPWIKRAKAALEDAILDGTLESDAVSAWRYLESHPELSRVTAIRRWPWPFLLLLLGAVVATTRLAPPLRSSSSAVLIGFLAALLFDAGFFVATRRGASGDGDGYLVRGRWCGGGSRRRLPSAACGRCSIRR